MLKFKIAEIRTFDWPIKIKMPREDKPGHFETIQVMGRFRMINKKRRDELKAEFEALQSDEEREAHQDDMLREAMIGWNEDDMVGADGKPVPFSREALDEALGIPPFRIAAHEAIASAMTGGASRGN